MLREAASSDKVSIIKSPEIFGFRNKMEYSFEGDNLGLHPRGKFSEVIDLKECPVFSDWVGGFLEKVREFARFYKIPFYKRREKKGILRYLILRESKFTGQKMVILVVDGDRFEYSSQWLEMVSENLSNVRSIVLARRHTTGDSAFTEDYDVLSGDERIEMKIGGMVFDLSPFSFFQPNSYQVENIYSLIERPLGDGMILDLFSGTGSISFFVSSSSREVRGIEACESCVRDALRNVEKINPPGKVEFLHSKVKPYIAALNERVDYVIIDPPRGGMSYRVWKHLKKIADKGTLKKIVYVCCSMKNLKTDLKYIRENTDWEIGNITGVDQFVHTPHLEAVTEISVPKNAG